MRRLLANLSSVLILSGALLLLDAAATLAWQEPLTALIAVIKRGEINRRYVSPQQPPLPLADRRALTGVSTSRLRIGYLARRERRELRAGDAIGRIVLPRLGAGFEVVQGTDAGSLQKGPGHYAATALPGMGETVAVAGHRTTYLAPFRHIDALAPGDRILMKMPYGSFTYVVQYRKVVRPTALWVIANVGYERLVLSACNPLYSAAQRLIVFARLATVVPLGAARAVA